MPFPRKDEELDGFATPMPTPMPTPIPMPAPTLTPPPPLEINQDGKNYQFTPGQNGSLMTKSGPPEPLVPPAPARRAVSLPGMPSSVSSDDIEAYLGRQKQSLNKYGPEDQIALQNQTLEDRNSLSSRLTSGAKGFADALMQGVAQQGNPGWQKDFEEQQNREAAEKMGTLQRAGELNTQRANSNMTLDNMDPKSPTSQAAQATYGPLFEKLGYPPEALSGMSKANIENALTLMAQYGGKEKEAEIQRYQAEMNSNENKRHNMEMEGLGKEKNQQEALTEFSKMPWYAHVTNRKALGAMENAAGVNKSTPSTGWKYIGKVGQ